MTPEIKFTYPVNYESIYEFPTRYYYDVSTGHSIIKRDQIIINDSVKIGPDGKTIESEENEAKD